MEHCLISPIKEHPECKYATRTKPLIAKNKKQNKIQFARQRDELAIKIPSFVH
jgi:hypothetical protein